MSLAKLPDSYRLTPADMEACAKASYDWLLDDIFDTAMQLRELTGKLPTIGEVRRKWADAKRAHDLLHYQSAQRSGALYDRSWGQIYHSPELLAPEKRKRLQREQAEALR